MNQSERERFALMREKMSIFAKDDPSFVHKTLQSLSNEERELFEKLLKQSLEFVQNLMWAGSFNDD